MQAPPIRLVVLGDVQGELQTSLSQCSTSARHHPGRPYPAPISLRVASGPGEALALVQDDLLAPSTCCAVFASQPHATLEPDDPAALVPYMRQHHPNVPLICWGDSSRVDLTNVKGCNIVLDWNRTLGKAPLLAVLRMLEGKEVKPETRLRISKPMRTHKDEDDALIIPVLALGIPTFYRPPSRQYKAVDVGDVHIPLAVSRGGGGGSSSERSSSGRQGVSGKHPWDRFTFFFASDSERTKMILDELRMRRAQERTGGASTATRGGAGTARQGGARSTTVAGTAAAAGSGGQYGGALDRMSTSSSVLWDGIGRAGASAAGRPTGPALPFAWDDEMASLASEYDLAALLQEAEALDRMSMGGPARDSPTGAMTSSGFGPSEQVPQLTQGSLTANIPGATAATAVAGTSSSGRVLGTGQLPVTQLSSGLLPARQIIGGVSATVPPSVGCDSPAVHAALLAEQLSAHKPIACNSEQVRALATEVEQLRRLVQVKRALEKLQDVPEDGEGDGVGETSTGTVQQGGLEFEGNADALSAATAAG